MIEITQEWLDDVINQLNDNAAEIQRLRRRLLPMIPGKYIFWNSDQVRPASPGQYLLLMENGNYTVENAWVPGSKNWAPIGKVNQWAYLGDTRK